MIIFNETPQQIQAIGTQQLKSKIKSISNYVQQLLQKKIRLDLEIRKQRKVITKLKKQTNFRLNASIQLESSAPSVLAPHLQEVLEENRRERVELNSLVEELNLLISEVDELEEFLYPS